VALIQLGSDNPVCCLCFRSNTSVLVSVFSTAILVAALIVIYYLLARSEGGLPLSSFAALLIASLRTVTPFVCVTFVSCRKLTIDLAGVFVLIRSAAGQPQPHPLPSARRKGGVLCLTVEYASS
jgi:hypothetical protein